VGKNVRTKIIWQEQSKVTDVKALRYGVATLELFSTVNNGAAGPLRVQEEKAQKIKVWVRIVEEN